MHQYNDHTDEELTALLTTGDALAFEVIYKRYVSALYRYTRNSISNKEDCEEIVQEVFESLWARHERLKHVTEIKPYLFGSVRYKIIRFFEHQKVKLKYAEHYKLFEAVYDTMPEEGRTPEAIQTLIQKLIHELPDRCRTAFTLRLTENLSNGEIAKRMNIKKGTVENYMMRTLKHLRSYPKEVFEQAG